MIFHVVKDKFDPEYRDCWDVVDENGRASLINRLSELRQDGIVLHRGVVIEKLPITYSFLENSYIQWSCYWFEK